MASLSITRRRAAWLDGVICGATGRGHCELKVPKLREIYDRGVAFGRANAETPSVKAAVAAKARPQAKPKANARPTARFRGRTGPGLGGDRNRFDRPPRRF
jgi:hypothetical protein